MERSNWNEFREAGLLWFINTTLHLFGWVIVLDKDAEGNITNAYPVKTKLRGFSEESNTRGYTNLTKHIRENLDFMESAFEQGPKKSIKEKVQEADLHKLVKEALTPKENEND